LLVCAVGVMLNTQIIADLIEQFGGLNARCVIKFI
jgi:hypothetical protein